MRAAADALAVRVEQDHLDAADVVPRQRLGDLQPQPLDQIAGGKLADIAAGIGIAELQRQPSGLLQIGAVVRAAQRLVQHVRAVLQRLGGLEQRADLDVLRDAEQPRQPQRGQQRVAALGLGDQETHRHRAIHVLDDLRHRHHQPRRRGLLGQQRAEIHRHRLHRVERRVDRDEQRPPMRRVLRRIGDAQPLAHHVVHLRRIQPHMRVRQRQAVRHQPGARDAQRQPRVIVRHLDRRAEQRQQRRRRHQRIVPPVHDRLCEGGDARRIGRVGARRKLRLHRLARRRRRAPRAGSPTAAPQAAHAAAASCSRFISSRSRSVSHQPISVRPSVS